MRREPTIDELRKLVAFAATEEVAATARDLDMEQSTLSRRLRVFKRPDDDGPAFLENRAGQLRMTERGRLALPAIYRVVRQYEQLLAFLDGETDRPRAVRLGLGHFAARHYLPHLLVALRPRSGELAVETHVARGRDRILGVAAGDFDLAVITHDPVQIDTMLGVHLGRRVPLAVEELGALPFCVAARRDSPAGRELRALPANRGVTERMLARWEFVGLDERAGIRRLIERRLRAVDATLRFVPGTGAGGWPAARRFVKEGLGVGLLPVAELHAEDGRDLVVRQLPPRFAIRDYTIRGQVDDPVLDDMIGLLKHAVRAVTASASAWMTSAKQ